MAWLPINPHGAAATTPTAAYSYDRSSGIVITKGRASACGGMWGGTELPIDSMVSLLFVERLLDSLPPAL